MVSNKFRKAAVFCLGVLLVCLLVEAAGRLKGDRLVFPGTGEILRAFVRLMVQAETWRKIGTTLMHLAEAVLLSTVLGVTLGLAEGLVPFLRELLRPLMTLLRSLPMIVVTVLVMVLLSYDKVPLVACTLLLLPLISEAACEGARRIEPELIDVYRMNSRLNLRVLAQVYLPLMGGYLKQAYINAVGMGIKLTVTTEYLVQTRDSLGKAVFTSAYFYEYADIYAYALIMVLLALLLGAVPALIKRLIPEGNRTTEPETGRRNGGQS